jgi:hypothetical protein
MRVLVLAVALLACGGGVEATADGGAEPDPCELTSETGCEAPDFRGARCPAGEAPLGDCSYLREVDDGIGVFCCE